jgi:hypothetical protein
MSFFKILDVIANSGQRNRLGGPNSLSGSGSYDRNTFRYPIDVGNYDKGHYILIHINEQTKTQFGNQQSNDEPTIIRNMRNLQGRRGSTNIGGLTNRATEFISGANDIPAVQEARNAVTGPISKLGGEEVASGFSSAAQSIGQGIGSITGDSFLRTIRRTTDTIALYMPDSLNFSNDQTYNSMNLSDSMFAQGAAATSSVLDSRGADGKIDSAAVGRNLSPFFLNFLAQKGTSIFGNSGKALFTAITGTVQNPMMEVIYSSPRMRSFKFDFMFYPRSEKEALEVQRILERLKFHQAPEIKSNSGGFFLIPPSEFDIKFMYNGKENPNIEQVSTCVLTNVSIDYAKNGFTTYEVEGENDPRLGRTGMPLTIGLSLSFTETQIITKEYYRGRYQGRQAEVDKLNGGNVNDPNSDYNTGNNGWGNYGE